jgi:hypothetical protein
LLHGFAHNGLWEGVTETGGIVRFSVSEHFITSVAVMTPGDGPNCSVSNSFSPIISIGNNHEFFIRQGGTPSYQLEGTIRDGWADGTLEIFRSARLCHTERWTARRPFGAPATIEVSRSSGTIDENGGRSNINVEADFPWALPRTIDLAYSGTAIKGTDYAVTPAEDIVIEPFELDASARITATNDSIYDPNETINVTVVSVSNGEIATPNTLPMITIRDDDPEPIPEISISRTSHDFGETAVDGASAITTFTIGNVGTATLVLTGNPPVTITGPDAMDFSIIQQPPSNIAPSNEVAFQVQFDPRAAGQRSASIVIATNDSDENPVAIQLTGVGVSSLGDYNNSGSVDTADYVVWRKSLNSTVPAFTGADGNGNGMVDQADYDIWRANFGRTSPTSGAAPSLAAAIDSDQTPQPLVRNNRPRQRGVFHAIASRDQALIELLANQSSDIRRDLGASSVVGSLAETNLRLNPLESPATLDAAFATL